MDFLKNIIDFIDDGKKLPDYVYDLTDKYILEEDKNKFHVVLKNYHDSERTKVDHKKLKEGVISILDDMQKGHRYFKTMYDGHAVLRPTKLSFSFFLVASQHECERSFHVRQYLQLYDHVLSLLRLQLSQWYVLLNDANVLSLQMISNL